MNGSRPYYAEKDKCHMISLNGLVVKNPSTNAGAAGLTPGRKDPQRRKWKPTSILPGKSRGQRSLMGYSPWGPKESDVTY